MYISDHRSFSFELAERQAHTLVGMGDIVGLRRDSHDPLACHKAHFRIASQSYSLLAFYKLSETHNTSICPYMGVLIIRRVPCATIACSTTTSAH